MLFNTFDFAIFFVLFFAIYWILSSNIKFQNFFIVAASYYFYASWNKSFLILIVLSTLIDFYSAQSISRGFRKKFFLWLSISFNLGALIYFKYANFFIDSFHSVFKLFGQDFNYSSLLIILPVGISFYTFQTMSYTIDVYRGKIKSSNDFIAFSAFVSFFPQLVAGPIERASNLLPQFFLKRVFVYESAIYGLKLILWGLVKKVVIADNAAFYVDQIFSGGEVMNSSALILGAVLFSFQIYGDFSGYSDIAIGTAKLLGFDLKKNFAYPYFSRDIAEFWRRWHISLSSWFKDYLYIPIGGSHGGKVKSIRNTFIVFLISGLWHGANWTFVIWGFINAILFLPLLIFNRNRINTTFEGEVINSSSIFKRVYTFILVSLAWIFFRSPDVSSAYYYFKGIFSDSFYAIPSVSNLYELFVYLILLCAFIFLEWKGRFFDCPIQFLFVRNRWVRYFFYYLLIILVLWYNGSEQEFIYFQF